MALLIKYSQPSCGSHNLLSDLQKIQFDLYHISNEKRVEKHDFCGVETEMEKMRGKKLFP